MKGKDWQDVKGVKGGEVEDEKSKVYRSAIDRQ